MSPSPRRHELLREIELLGGASETVARHHRNTHMMRHDLALAGIDYVDGDGKVADFHSLRVTYISAVVRSGAPVKEAQALARHSDPSLTFSGLRERPGAGGGGDEGGASGTS